MKVEFSAFLDQLFIFIYFFTSEQRFVGRAKTTYKTHSLK
jgi:hypothetical protein